VLAFVLTTSLSAGGGAKWSLYESLASRIALLDSVRAPGKAALAVCFGLQALGAIGWSRLMSTIGAWPAAVVAALLVALTAAEVSPPDAARTALGSGAPMQLREVAPPPERIAALTSTLGDRRDGRAVLDLPTGRMVKAPAALLDAVWHGHPTSACYNSLYSPVIRETAALAERSHDEHGIEELAAAGFGFVIERPRNASSVLSANSFARPARLVSMGSDIAIWSLPHPGVLHHDIAKLSFVATGGAVRGDAYAPDPPNELDVEVTNRSEEMFAAPRPLEPLFADVELANDGGTVIFRSRARGVLPLALSPGAKRTVQLTLPDAPPAGAWHATLRIEGATQVSAAPDFRWADSSR
jgi:hypothetical protein